MAKVFIEIEGESIEDGVQAYVIDAETGARARVVSANMPINHASELWAVVGLAARDNYKFNVKTLAQWARENGELNE